MPAWIGCHAVTETGAIVALRTGLFDFDSHTGELLAFWHRRRSIRAAFCINDGRCDRQGQVLHGTYVPAA